MQKTHISHIKIILIVTSISIVYEMVLYFYHSKNHVQTEICTVLIKFTFLEMWDQVQIDLVAQKCNLYQSKLMSLFLLMSELNVNYKFLISYLSIDDLRTVVTIMIRY